MSTFESESIRYYMRMRPIGRPGPTSTTAVASPAPAKRAGAGLLLLCNSGVDVRLYTLW